MSSDSTTTIQELKDLLKQFRDERHWQKFHDPKNLAEAISIEAAELLELFLWKSAAEIEGSLASDADFRKSVQEELADIMCFSLNLANAAQIDVATSIKEKIKSNSLKYPADKAKGIALKYDKL